ncbi:MAG: lipoyltransferase [Duncaniella sp.]|nr:lipoyltransferase [Duncaniella sp.]
MKLVTLPDNLTRPLPFYLAEEEWLARLDDGEDYFFMWQVEPTVIIGRNQLAAKEVDLDYCRQAGIPVIRRKSGGGAVLADLNNIMLSYITTTNESVATTFTRYTSMIAGALRTLGTEASSTSRNDVLIGEGKVSGNSYYRLGRRSIVHGTMLYDCDRELMSRVLRPSAAKLRSHGVESVRSRVTTIREHMPELSIDDFKKRLSETILKSGVETVTLSKDDITDIEKLSHEYHDPARLTALNPPADIEATCRINGIGTLSAHVTLRKGIIYDFSLTGDYLETGDASATFGALLSGAEFTPEGVRRTLAGLDTEALVPGLSLEQIIDLLFD